MTVRAMSSPTWKHSARPQLNPASASPAQPPPPPSPPRTSLADAYNHVASHDLNVDTLLGPANGPQAGVIVFRPGSHPELNRPGFYADSRV